MRVVGVAYLMVMTVVVNSVVMQNIVA